MTHANLSLQRLGRMRESMSRHVERGDVPGLVTLVSRRGETVVEALGTTAKDGAAPMRRDTIFRISSITKPMTAVAAMMLVESCKIRLDDPVDAFLPELADRQVLQRTTGALDETVPASRPITVRDLLTMRQGFGHIMSRSASGYPIVKAATEAGVLHGPPKPQQGPDADELLRRLSALPLMHQPGERWMYELGMELLGVLIARASGQSLGQFMAENVFAPLGMVDTSFSVDAARRERLATSYEENAETGELELYDAPDGEWSRPPVLESGAAGLVSTADDVLAFYRMLLDGGRGPHGRLLARTSVEAMTSDQLEPEHRRGAEVFFGDSCSWGLGMGVVIHRHAPSDVPGRFGWDGGLGCSAWADPKEELVGVLLTQRAVTSPAPPAIYRDFWTSAYQAIDD